jgi:hypothetical protein
MTALAGAAVHTAAHHDKETSAMHRRHLLLSLGALALPPLGAAAQSPLNRSSGSRRTSFPLCDAHLA